MYVIRRNDGAYLSVAGSKSSYTWRLELAQKFLTKREAEKDRCPGNEYVIHVLDILSK